MQVMNAQNYACLSRACSALSVQTQTSCSRFMLLFISKVKNMKFLFVDAQAFDKPLNKWKPTSVKDMSTMFFGAEVFKQNLCSWLGRAPTKADVNQMFEASGCPQADNPDLSSDGPMCKKCYIWGPKTRVLTILPPKYLTNRH
jgi:hypothetical protein